MKIFNLKMFLKSKNYLFIYMQNTTHTHIKCTQIIFEMRVGAGGVWWCMRRLIYYYLLAGLNHFGIVPPAPNDDDAVVDDLNEPPALVVGLVTSSERFEPPTAPAPSLLPASSNCTSSLLSCDNPLN